MTENSDKELLKECQEELNLLRENERTRQQFCDLFWVTLVNGGWFIIMWGILNLAWIGLKHTEINTPLPNVMLLAFSILVGFMHYWLVWYERSVRIFWPDAKVAFRCIHSWVKGAIEGGREGGRKSLGEALDEEGRVQ